MSLFVQKYGGTSLRDIPSRKNLVRNARKCVEDGNDLVIVVSAIGRHGDPYATDTLISQLENINIKIDPKKKDLIMSCGETISSAIISHLLESEGLSSIPLTGYEAGILTDNNFTESKIIDVDTSRILEYIKKGKIVVVAGFQGATINREITTLGRGGSDTTAVILGGYLNATRVDIFTDVPGIAIIDPSIVSHAAYIENISYNDIYELSSSGVGVIHPRAVIAGKQFDIPISIRSSYSDEGKTLIWDYKNSNPKKIIGIALKEEEEDIGIISIVFQDKYRSSMEKDIKDFVFENESILRISYYPNKISIFLDKAKTKSCAKDLYKYFFPNN